MPENGTLKLSGNAISEGQEILLANLGNITFTPKANWNGTTSFSWNGSDELTFADIDTNVNIIIEQVFDSQIAINDINTTFKNISVAGNVLLNDVNPDGAQLLVTSESKSTSNGGSVIIYSNGDYIYTPKNGFTGKDVFSYTLCNNASTLLCVQATVTINVLPNNNSGYNPPIGINDNYKGIVNSTVTGTVLSNDLVYGGNSLVVSTSMYDSNGDGIPDANFNLGTPVSVWGINKSEQAVEAGTLSLNNNGTFTFIPATAFEGLVTFKYAIVDSKGKSDYALVTIYIINGNSTYAVDDVYFTDINNSISGNLLANDYDPEGEVQTLVTTPLKSPKHGSVVLNPDGSFTYTPNEGYVGTDQFVYEIFDAEYPPSRDSATVYINIVKTSITLTLKAKLQGASVDVNNTSVYTTLMRDDLRSKGLIPLSSPYIGLTNSITDSASVLANKNENSIVDWVYIEVRKANAPATVITSTPGLIQRDGDIVDVDGVSPLMIGGLDTIASGTAYITVRHRNHLGI